MKKSNRGNRNRKDSKRGRQANPPDKESKAASPSTSSSPGKAASRPAATGLGGKIRGSSLFSVSKGIASSLFSSRFGTSEAKRGPSAASPQRESKDETSRPPSRSQSQSKTRGGRSQGRPS